MDQRIQFASGFIVGRDDERPLRVPRILTGYCTKAFLRVNDLMHAASLVETRNSSVHVSARELPYRFLQSRVLLTHNFTQLGYPHSSFLQLLVWPARFHRLMLPCIPYQKDPVGHLQAMKEFVNLFRAREARFIDNEKPLPSVIGRFVLDEVALQRVRLNS